MGDEAVDQGRKRRRGSEPSNNGHAEVPLSFRLAAGRTGIIRSVFDTTGRKHATELGINHPPPDLAHLSAAFDLAWLRLSAAPWAKDEQPRVRIADIFSGCGAMTLAAWALGLGHEAVIAIDTDEDALGVFRVNFDPGIALGDPVESLFDGDVRGRLTRSERGLRSGAGRVDLLLAGPPCQGNSDLNNHTRRADPKNGLYARMARCAEVLRPTHVVIENVPGVLHDKGNVVGRTEECLRRLGYSVVAGILDADAVGVPQIRRRHFMIASQVVSVDLEATIEAYRCTQRPLSWAIQDLLDVPGEDSFDVAATLSSENQGRVAYLFDNGLYDLPDSQRPDCHRLKAHTYKAMYGRLRWDHPAPTITSGFASPGQGRYIHPLRQRTLTPHEAARIQFFPDFFRFGHLSRSSLRALIANAVPSKLTFVVVLELLRNSPGFLRSVKADPRSSRSTRKVIPRRSDC
jgi:DNA (cytosine-5)-methyltransferase 1